MLTLAIGASVLLHAVVLSIHFNLPDQLRKLAAPATLDVVLVNAKSHKRPVKADVLAQANLDGGGNTDQDRMVKSSRPATAKDRRGDDLRQAAQRVRELEAQQRQLLAQLKASAAQTSPTPAPTSEPAPTPALSGTELRARSLNAMKLQAQIARQTEEYNKRPYKLFIGARASEYAAAQYLDQWTQRIERIGNLNYPEMARGRFYGKVQVSVEIKPDGSLAAFEIIDPSNYEVLNRAAENIIRIAAPYAAIPANVLKGNDVLVFTRTVIFERGDRVLSN
jgi:protein TonB